MVMPEGGRGCRKVDEAWKVLILTRFARRWTDRNYVVIQTLPRLGSRVRIPSSAPFFCLPFFLLCLGKSSHSPDFLHYPSRERTQLHIQIHFKLNLPVCQMRPFAAKRGQSEWSYSGHAFCTFCTGKASKYSLSPPFRSVYGAFAECGHPRGHASGHAHAGLPEKSCLGNCNLAQRCATLIKADTLISPNDYDCCNRRDCVNELSRVKSRRHRPSTWSCLWS